LLISSYILWQSARLLPRAVGILMEGVPPGLDVHELTAAMREVDDVVDVHQIHAWELGEHNRAIEAHIVVDTDDIETLERVKHELRQLCADRFHTDHTTFELEWPEHALCPTTSAGRRRPQE
jgi:cobalt-zinc-cadmium efflux system protein